MKTLFNPNGVASVARESAATPLGLTVILRGLPRVARGLATLGSTMESRWDSRPAVSDLLVMKRAKARPPNSPIGPAPRSPGILAGRNLLSITPAGMPALPGISMQIICS